MPRVCFHDQKRLGQLGCTRETAGFRDVMPYRTKAWRTKTAKAQRKMSPPKSAKAPLRIAFYGSVREQKGCKERKRFPEAIDEEVLCNTSTVRTKPCAKNKQLKAMTKTNLPNEKHFTESHLISIYQKANKKSLENSTSQPAAWTILTRYFCSIDWATR